MTTQWVGPYCADPEVSVDSVHFLVRRYFHNTRAQRFDLQSNPAVTNRSHEPTLVGCCGGTNNVNLYACGLVRVTRVCKNGRVLVRELDGVELSTALESLGWPELAPEIDEEVITP